LLNRRLRPEPSEAPLHDPGEARDLEGALPSFDDLQFPTIVTHFDDPGLAGVKLGQVFECLMKPNHHGIGLRGEDQRIVQSCSMCGTFTLCTVPRPGVIDENAAHDPSAHGKKVRPVLPIDLPYVHEPKISLVYKSSGLNGVIGTLPA
jgi:hypothetical protein